MLYCAVIADGLNMPQSVTGRDADWGWCRKVSQKGVLMGDCVVKCHRKGPDGIWCCKMSQKRALMGYGAAKCHRKGC